MAHDFAVDVGEAKLAILMAVGQSFVVEPPKMQDRDVEIVRVNRCLNDNHSEIIGSAV